jgi:hypothetical protein
VQAKQKELDQNKSLDLVKDSFFKEITFKNKYGLGVKHQGNGRLPPKETCHKRR